MRPHRQQPTRLPHSWDSPGKITGVGCHFLLQCMIVKSESEVSQSCPALGNLMDCSLPRLLCPWDFPGKSTGVGCHSAYKSLNVLTLKSFFFFFGPLLTSSIAIPCPIQTPSYFLNHWNNLPVVFTSRHHHLKTLVHILAFVNTGKQKSVMSPSPIKVFFVFPVLWWWSLNSIVDHLRGLKPGSPALPADSLPSEPWREPLLYERNL